MECGDVVTLKGQSRKMTILHQSDEFFQWWRCGWFDDGGAFQSQDLPEKALQQIDPNPHPAKP